MVIMATSFSADGYDVLEDPSIENGTSFLSDRLIGVQLSCWGRIGHQLPRLSDIFVPRHVVTYNEPDEDPAFKRLSEYRDPEQSFSLYDDDDAANEQNDLDGLSDQDEIYHSDSDYSTKNEDLSEDEDPRYDAHGHEYNRNEKVINRLPCEDKINAIDHLNSNHFESSKLSHLKVFDNSYNHDNDLADVLREFKTQKRKEISFVVEEEGEDKARPMLLDLRECEEELESFPIANYALGKKTEENILFQPKKKSKVKKRATNKNVQGQMMLSDLAADETEFKKNDDHIDDLQLYYQNFGSYHAGIMPTSSKSEFPELLTTSQRSTPRKTSETDKKFSSGEEQQKLDFRSVTESFMPAPLYEDDQKREKYNEWQLQNNQDLLIIKNLQFGLSEDQLKSYLESFGTVQDLTLEVNNEDITATVIMNCDLDWVIEALDGNSLEGAEYDSSRKLSCYKIIGNK